MDPWTTLTLGLLGGGGIGALINAAINAWKTHQTVPVELAGTNAKIQVDLVGAAGAIIDQLQEQSSADRAEFNRRLGILEAELARWREETAGREHELEASRMHMALQDERISTQDRRIAALEAEVRRLGGDPANVTTPRPDTPRGTPI